MCLVVGARAAGKTLTGEVRKCVGILEVLGNQSSTGEGDIGFPVKRLVRESCESGLEGQSVFTNIWQTRAEAGTNFQCRKNRMSRAVRSSQDAPSVTDNLKGAWKLKCAPERVSASTHPQAFEGASVSYTSKISHCPECWPKTKDLGGSR